MSVDTELDILSAPATIASRRASLTWLEAVVDAMNPVDLFVIGYAILATGIAIFGASRIHEWPWVLLNSAIIIVAVYFINLLRSKSNDTRIQLVHIFYIILLVPIFFKTMEKMSFALHGQDYDTMLITADRLIFHTDPTVWLYTHIPVMPFFVEYLQIAYFLFYFLPIALMIEMYRRRLDRAEGRLFEDTVRDELEELRFVVFYGFCLSYIGYLFYPAIGPRFTLHDFLALPKELPGVFFTNILRDIMNAGENIKEGMQIGAIKQVVTRDAFPSGHTDITLLTMILAFKFKAKVRWPIFILGMSLLFSTVYLRYHYVIDLVGGLVFAMITLYTWTIVEGAMLSIRAWLLRSHVGRGDSLA